MSEEIGDDLTSDNPAARMHAWAREVSMLKPFAHASANRQDADSLEVVRAWGLAQKGFAWSMKRYATFLEQIMPEDP